MDVIMKVKAIGKGKIIGKIKMARWLNLYMETSHRIMGHLWTHYVLHLHNSKHG